MTLLLLMMACSGTNSPDDPSETSVSIDTAQTETAETGTAPTVETGETGGTESTPPTDTDEPTTPETHLEAGGVVACPDPGARIDAGPFSRTGGGEAWATQGWMEPPGDRPNGRGLIVADFDGDDLLDILLLNMGTDQLFMGQPDLTWADETAIRWGLATDYSMGGAAADVDDDGDLDVVVANRGQVNRVYLNDGSGHFAQHNAGLLDEAWGSTGAALADMDGDGDLDIFFSGHWSEAEWDYTDGLPGDPSELYENLGGGNFADASAGLPQAAMDSYTFVGGWADLDDDGTPDLYLANDHGPFATPNQALLGGEAGFTDVSAETRLDRSLLAMGIGVGDLNDDLVPDFLISGWDELALMESAPDGTWYDSALSRRLTPSPTDAQHVAWGAELADIDNDGRLDAMATFGQWRTDVESERADPSEQPDALWWQDSEGSFVPVGQAWGLADTARSRTLVLADLNRDGFLDVVRAPLDGPASIDLSRCDDAAWLSVALVQPDGNRDAVGATVIAEYGSQRKTRWINAGGTSLSSSGPLVAHFGLGTIPWVDLTILWPDGGQDTFEQVDTRQRITITRE